MTDDPTPAPVRVGDWTRRTRATAYVNPWITIWHDEVIRPDGSDGIYGVVHLANLAVGVIAIDEQDRVVLVGQHRYALDAFSWELPEGGSPSGEIRWRGRSANSTRRPGSPPRTGRRSPGWTSRTR